MKRTPTLLLAAALLGLCALPLVPVSAASLTSAQDADTLTITLAQAQARFLDANLSLLAARFGIASARARALQAGLWDNPVLTLENAVWNPNTHRVLDVYDRSTESGVQIQQLIQLAGKRGLRVRLGELDARSAELALLDLERTLKYTLHTAFFDLHFLRRSLHVYDEGIRTLSNTVASYKALEAKGVITAQEVLRLQALLFSLEGDRMNVRTNIADRQATLLMLLGDSTHAAIAPVFGDDLFTNITSSALKSDSLVAIALRQRGDLLAAQSDLERASADVSLQHALAVPDLTVGGVYDRNGSAWAPYFGVQVQFSLPLFDRNQGGIAAADAALEGARVRVADMRNAVARDVARALASLRERESLVTGSNSTFTDEYERFMRGYVGLYEKRTIGLLEFTDMFESYRDSLIRMNQIMNDRMNACGALECATGTPLFRYE